MAGSYPALYLSRMTPVRVLKGSQSTGYARSWFRRILVLGQFSLAAGLVAVAAVIFLQMEFIRNKGLGFDREQMVYFLPRGDFARNYAVIKEELLAHPSIIGVTAGEPPVLRFGSQSEIKWEGMGEDDSTGWTSLAVDPNYVETFGMTIVQGQDLSELPPAEARRSMLVNETAARLMGLDNPVRRQISIKRHSFDGSALAMAEYEGTIVGVVGDFHYGSLHSAIGPVAIFADSAQARRMCVRIQPGRTAEAMALLEEYWQRYASEYLMEYQFVDESIDAFYRSEQQLSLILTYFTALAIFVSCLGLFGLASYLAETRTKEIAVRKVLGSSVTEVMTLLCRESIVLVILANVIIWPVAWYIISIWLERFVYRIDVGPAPFVVTTIVTVALALLSVGYQAFRAARTSPAYSLRYE
jgi:hypothetical protein